MFIVSLFFFLLSKYLSEPNYETLVAIQIGIMEQTIAVIDKVSIKDIDYYNANSRYHLNKVIMF